jgi:hypothetical protein
MKKSGSKILGIAAAIAVVIYWGNVLFGGKYSSSSKKSSSQLNYINANDNLICTSNDGTVISEMKIFINYKTKEAFTMILGGYRVDSENFRSSDLMYTGYGYDDLSSEGLGSNVKWDLRVNRKTGAFTHTLGNNTIAGKCVK